MEKRIKFIPWVLSRIDDAEESAFFMARGALRALLDDPDALPQVWWPSKKIWAHALERGCALASRPDLKRAIKVWRNHPFVEEALKPPRIEGVYCVSAGSWPGIVKIGGSYDVKKRVQGLSTSLPGRAKFHAVLSLRRQDETLFHERFKKYRIPGGEWFHVRGSLARLLEKLGPR
jgi:hypothetical protein